VAIIRAFKKIDPPGCPGSIGGKPRSFCLGADPRKAAENAWMLEAVARMAYFTIGINPRASCVSKTLHDRHFLRKHGKEAYYGKRGQRNDAAIASADASRLVRLSMVDLVIIVFYFALVLAIGFYLKERSNTGEDFSWPEEK